MRQFPNQLVSTVSNLEYTMDARGNAALARLHEKGYTVATGLTPYYAGAISLAGQQNHIREYCPKDATPSRFGTLQSTRQWVTKGGGRGVFLLLGRPDSSNQEVDGQTMHGYGWTGYEASEELPDHPITSAYRLTASALGKHLSKDFVQVVVSGTHTLYAPDEGIGLETWKSNHAAGMYQDVGFALQHRPDQPQELRPSLRKDAVDGKILDTRLYMAYPNELFDQR